MMFLKKTAATFVVLSSVVVGGENTRLLQAGSSLCIIADGAARSCLFNANQDCSFCSAICGVPQGSCCDDCRQLFLASQEACCKEPDTPADPCAQESSAVVSCEIGPGNLQTCQACYDDFSALAGSGSYTCAEWGGIACNIVNNCDCGTCSDAIEAQLDCAIGQSLSQAGLTSCDIDCSATDLPATDPPVTDPPVTDPPVTDPPITDPPATDPPATDPPATGPLATTNPPATTDPPATPDPPPTPAPTPSAVTAKERVSTIAFIVGVVGWLAF